MATNYAGLSPDDSDMLDQLDTSGQKFDATLGSDGKLSVNKKPATDLYKKYDWQGAFSAGLSSTEILDALDRANALGGYRLKEARKAGLDDDQIAEALQPKAAPVKPDRGDFLRGGKEAFQQLPQLGYGLAAGAAAGAETAFGDGGLATSMKQWALKGYKEWSDKIESQAKESDSFTYSWDEAKKGNIGALVDWVQHGLGYAGGQAVQMLATAGLGGLVGKATLGTAAKTLAEGMVSKEAAAIAASDAAKGLTADQIGKIATANVATRIGQSAAIGAQAFGMEGGEIFGDLAEKNKDRTLTGDELAKAFGATLAAGGLEFVGDKLGFDVLTGKLGLSIKNRVGRGLATGALAAPIEGGTEYLQTGIEEYGKGNEANILPFNQSEKAQREAFDAAALGAIGGFGTGGVGGAIHTPTAATVPITGDVQTDIDAIIAAPITPIQPRGSFAKVDELANFAAEEKANLADRRSAIAQDQTAKENEFADFAKSEQSDLAYLRRDAAQEAQKARDFTQAIEQKRDQTIDQANVLTEVSGVDSGEPTAMQLAMERARKSKPANPVQESKVEPAPPMAPNAPVMTQNPANVTSDFVPAAGGSMWAANAPKQGTTVPNSGTQNGVQSADGQTASRPIPVQADASNAGRAVAVQANEGVAANGQAADTDKRSLAQSAATPTGQVNGQPSQTNRAAATRPTNGEGVGKQGVEGLVSDQPVGQRQPSATVGANQPADRRATPRYNPEVTAAFERARQLEANAKTPEQFKAADEAMAAADKMLHPQGAPQQDSPVLPGDRTFKDGRLFSTVKSAELYQRQNNVAKTATVVPIIENGKKVGYALRPKEKTKGQIIAAEQRKKARVTPSPERDNLWTYIGKLGGLNPDEIRSTWGIDKADKFRSSEATAPTIRGKGQGESIDSMLEKLHQAGFRDAEGKVLEYPAQLEEMFKEGDQHYHPVGKDRLSRLSIEARALDEQRQAMQPADETLDEFDQLAKQEKAGVQSTWDSFKDEAGQDIHGKDALNELNADDEEYINELAKRDAEETPQDRQGSPAEVPENAGEVQRTQPQSEGSRPEGDAGNVGQGEVTSKENVDSVNTSQERVAETQKSEQVAPSELTQVTEALKEVTAVLKLQTQSRADLATKQAQEESKAAEEKRIADLERDQPLTLQNEDKRAESDEQKKKAAQGPLFSRGGIWKSQMLDAIGTLMANQEPAKQLAIKVEAWAKAGKFKQDELTWSGLSDWLKTQEGKVTKAQVQDFIRENGVQVEEVLLGSPDLTGETARRQELREMSFDELADEAESFGLVLGTENRADVESAIIEAQRSDDVDMPDIGQTKFQNYQLPGGENYRELLLTLPEKSFSVRDAELRKNSAGKWAWFDGDKQITGAFEDKVDAEWQATKYNTMHKRSDVNFRSSHFDQPNILAHIRFNERTDAEGKRVLFIEEIQSDWAQKGRKDGFRPSAPDAKLIAEAQRSFDESAARGENAADWRARHPEYVAAMQAQGKSESGIPSAPFVHNTTAWTSLALKRMVKYAIDNGFDKVAFTTGEQQAARYDLSKQVSRVEWLDAQLRGVGVPDLNAPEGTGTIRVYDKDGKLVKDDQIEYTDLADWVGKDVAEKLLAQKPTEGSFFGTKGRKRELSGLDLKVGGEGMRGYYDKIIPSVANDLLKKLGGGKVEDVVLGKVEGDKISSAEMQKYAIQFMNGEIDANELNDETGLSFTADQYDDMLGDGANRPASFQREIARGFGKLVQERLGGQKKSAQMGFTITDAMRESAQGGLPLFARQSKSAQSLQTTDARAAADVITKKWKNAPKITVHESLTSDSVPEGLRAAMEKDGVTDARGAWYAGGIELFPSNIGSLAELERTIVHEARHYGLEGLFGKDMNPILMEIYMKDKGVRTEANRLVKTLKLSTVDAVNETLANMPLDAAKKLPGWKKLVAKIKAWLNDHGFTNLAKMLEGPTADEITKDILYQIEDFVKTGKRSDTTFTTTLFHRAFHGSPHDHDGFSLDKIGTGEGAQAYGYGLYFAGSKAVADHYRQALSSGGFKTFNYAEAAQSLGIENYEDIRKVFYEMADSQAPTGIAVRRIQNASAASRNIDQSKLAALVEQYRKASSGKLYEVELAPKQEDYLDWDKPVPDEIIRKVAEKSVKDGIFEGDVDEAIDLLDEYSNNGEALYRGLEEQFGTYYVRDHDPSKVSMFLKSLGVRGIRYLDGSSRSKGEGNYNFVIFDDKDVSIVAKYSRTDQTESPAFKRWFGNSRVVDSNGKPLILYHGTDADIQEFRDGGGVLGDGIYLTSKRDEASTYADPNGDGTQGVVYPVYASIKNPATVAQAEAIANKDGEGWVRSALQKQGYDGIISDDGTYVAFKPEQVKTAIGNNGDFSPTNPDIRYSRTAADQSAIKDRINAFIEKPGKPIVHGDLNDAQAKALENVFGKPLSYKDRAQKLFANAGLKLAQGMVDQFAPLKELGYREYMLARMSKGTDGTLEATLKYGIPVLDKATGLFKMDTKGGGFIDRLKGLNGEQDRWAAWMAARRAENLKMQGKENLFSNDDIKTLKTLSDGTFKDGTSRRDAYLKASEDLAQFNKAILDIAQDKGIIDPESRKIWEQGVYIPFYRNLEDGTTGPSIKSGLVNQYAFKKLKGGKQNLNEDLLANILQNWGHLLSASAKNVAAKAALDKAAEIGVAYEVPSGTKGAVRYLENGAEKHFAVEDEFILDAITSMEAGGLPDWAKPLGKFKHYLTMGVTANPTFKIRNLIRDSLAATAMGKLSFNPIANVKQGIKATARDNPTFINMMANGGIIRFGSMLEGNRADHTRRLIESGVKDSTILDTKEKVAAAMQKAWDAYNEFGDRSENANRAALFEQNIAAGMDPLEAMFGARDLMDFSMSGSWKAVRFLTQVVPFMNARMQGLYKLGRAAKEDPRRMAYVMGAVSLASIALMLAYGDDDDWKKREDWDRDNYWWFKVGGVAFRIPKPFEVGAVGTVAERSLEYLISKEMTGKRYADRMANIVSNTFSMSPVPQMVKPMVDLYANKDSFTGRPIEGMGMERLRPQDRFNGGTSEFAKFLGKAGLPDPAQALQGKYSALSPIQIDHLVRGYFGWLGSSATTALDYGVRPLLDRPSKPSMQLKDVFLAGNFVESLPSGSSRYVTQVYEQAKTIEEAYNSYRDALKRGDIEGARSIMASERENISKYKMVEQIKRREGELNQAIKRIQDGNATPEEKRARIDQLNATKDRLARTLTARSGN